MNANTEKQYIGTASPRPVSPWNSQVGGSHYKDKVIQPLQYTLAVKGFDGFDGACHNHVARYTSRVKGCPVENLKKARHILDLWIYEAQKEADSK